MAGTRHTGNPGNFAEDRAKAARAAHIGGQLATFFMDGGYHE